MASGVLNSHSAEKMSKEIPVDVEAYAAEYTGGSLAVSMARL
jgi:hypothetical protein